VNTKNKLLEIATNIFKVLGSAENLSKITISEDEKFNKNGNNVFIICTFI
jgi:hypothetical protein